MIEKNPTKKIKGPCMILAGAGTGKTYTIVEKIKYLLENSIYSPERIVCLTFSNEATNSLRNRILPILKDEKEPIIRTFHSFCADVLRKHGSKIGIKENFRILLPEDAKIMLHKNLKVQPYQCHQYVSTIGTAKDLGISIEEFENYLEKKSNSQSNEEIEKKLENLEFKFKTLYLRPQNKNEKLALLRDIENLSSIIKIRKFVNVWKAYEKIKQLKNYQDYSDLNKESIELLSNHPEITEEYDYIIVDEFQDTNKLQFDFLKLIAPHKNITIVGDLNQSIYRFRGAYKENFNSFKKEFTALEEEVFTLDKSFRSPNKILKIAHQLIKNNYKNPDECFFVTNSENKEGEKINIFELNNAKEEVRKIIEIINKEIKQGTPENEICILFRTHQQAQLLKKSLKSENIEFTAVGAKSLLKTKEIKKILDYLRLANASKNESKGFENSWWNLLQDLNFSKEDLIKIGRFLKKRNKPEPITKTIIEIPSQLNLSDSGNLKTKIITKKIEKITNILDSPITEIIHKTIEIIGLGNSELEKIEKEKFLCLQKFMEMAKEFSETDSSEVSDFLHHIMIIENLGIEVKAPTTENKGIRIMTQHAAKGLEYKIVIISNFVQKRFPMERVNTNPLIPSELSPELKNKLKGVHESEKESVIREYEKQNQLLEERRLCYVAFTRTKERLYVLFAKEYSNKKFWPSQFLNEINYKQNKDIIYTLDKENLFNEPELKIKTAESDLDSLKELEVKFSPSSLLCFDECQKKYEYRYVYNMPEPKPISWEAINLGSFVHQIADIGVKQNFKTEKEFILLAKSLQAEEEWESVDINQAIPIIKVFFERNKNKYTPESKTEIHLHAKIEGLHFHGYADRIDFHEDGLEIIDYKTGNSYIQPKARNFQLGFYALAAKENYGKVKKLTLDMLKKEKPIEFILDNEGNALESGGRMSFNLQETKDEMIQVAKNILEAYNSGFKPCSIEANCEFCNEYVWGI
ncbi:hypothetical protein COU62_04780 [Candidatus Pacearchaeota archaeon CG10_big_fil_rev_8_21_14_0_10_35_219]|nr:ATP-dependent helicase [Candidatus Pacearchaeota archaeon]OIO42893.1 MAG: hypothetical protein AUJ63_01625 [Candidatus Pacearchaeota archaeon CG1_02_35_32]PIO07116.1 MAG: hypothetical protein COU62_04780 [Candidatus Pacearchaeota archaeon CG10_big_fil_rev_8_21_14_0_10_35_219]PIY81659.1 MAG: hypothetical protein COY79_01555 [Candidatus Pacearchaeota archaeon CG_4_10_14_0_8_um_filter_35_169]PIZ80910.1 MAG: hypothetical protein COY00_00130 [Candidatus Pacearchaeota archaeon CG_4_10_14_0_2_um_fi